MAGPLAGEGGRSLMEYVRARRRAECKVCALPPEITEQLSIAREKKITQDVVIAWLKDEHGIVLSADELLAHKNARHEQASA